jgi:hypothetical protein
MTTHATFAELCAPRLTAYCGPLIGFLLGTIRQTRQNFTINRHFCACVGQCFRLGEAIPALFCKVDSTTQCIIE